METAEQRLKRILNLKEIIEKAKKTKDKSRAIAELRTIVRLGHSDDCDLGSVPACTCGKRDAAEILKENFDW